MTSWERGKENEEKGEADMQSPNVGDKVKGAAEKAAGEVEQVTQDLPGHRVRPEGLVRAPGANRGRPRRRPGPSHGWRAARPARSPEAGPGHLGVRPAPGPGMSRIG